jgi:ribosomal protein S27AE
VDVKDRLAELRELRDTVGSLKTAAEMMGLSYGYVRNLCYRHGLSRKRKGDKNVTLNLKACPECGGSLKSDNENGEIACMSCGIVVERSHLVPGSEQYKGKAPQNFLMADTCGLEPKPSSSSKCSSTRA